MSVQRVVAGWTRLVEAKACLTSRIRATDTFLNLSTQSRGHTGCNPAGISKRVIQPGLFQYFNFFYHLRCQGKVLGTKSNLYKTFQERFCSQELKKHLSFFSFSLNIIDLKRKQRRLNVYSSSILYSFTKL